MYIWARPDWPNFTWDDRALIEPLATARLNQGRLLGRMQGLGFDLQLEAQLQALTEDVLKSSEIEGDLLEQIPITSHRTQRPRSSWRIRLG